MNHFQSNIIKTDVTVIKLFNKFIFIGIGGYLHVYNKESKILLKKFHIFDKQLFGIDIDAGYSKLLLYGGNRIKIFSLDAEKLEFYELKSYECNDWILTAKFVDNGSRIVTVSMHNVAVLWNLLLIKLQSYECEEKCILYCATAANDTWDNTIILSGTVFSQILLWRPAKSTGKLCPVLARLNGHKGVIFSIDYSPKLGVICSTSDDRTAIIWSIESKDLLIELQKLKKTILLKHTLYGHTARVFKCQLLDNYVVTGGEDCFVNIWNLEGELARKIDTQQGGCIWSLDCNEHDNIVVTGGGDCGVSIYSLNLIIKKEQLKIDHLQTPKRIVVLANCNLAVVTEDGTLVHFTLQNKKSNVIRRHDDLKSYALLEKSGCGNFIALASYFGNVHVYRATESTLEYLSSCQIKSKTRIFSVHWLSCKNLLTCGPDGVLILWTVKSFMTPAHFMELPPSKERWTTSSCRCGNEQVLVGDRRGNLYLYSFESAYPVQVLKKAHNYLGITNLYFKDDTVISLGRNSVLNKYQYNEKKRKINLVSSDKVPFTWLAALHEDKASSLLFAFSGNSFIIWDYNGRRTLVEEECGGGHRSWDLNINKKYINFCFVKDKKINVIACDRVTVQPIDILHGYHINEINTLRAVKLLDEPLKCLLISGGEDTTLRLSSLDSDAKSSSFKTLNVLKSHLSSIRAIDVFNVSSTDASECTKYFIFTAGGREQIILWELLIKYENSAVLSVTCSERHVYYEPLNKEEAETRIMDLCVVLANARKILLAACSDGCIKTFSVDLINSKLVYLKSFSYKLRCILKISSLTYSNHVIIVTMATDGYINFWDLKDNECDLTQFSQIKAHQSGINSYSAVVVNEETRLILTGGDDNAISLNLIQFKCDDDLEVRSLATYSNTDAHCAQITGAFVDSKYFITTSIDQKVLLFSWNIDHDRIYVQHLNRYDTCICDVQGLEGFVSGKDYKLVIYGRGVEVLTLNLNEKCTT